MAEEFKNQSEQEWEDAFNPYTPKQQKTHTEWMHEQGKRDQAALNTDESQAFMNQFKEGIKKDNPGLLYTEEEDQQ